MRDVDLQVFEHLQDFGDLLEEVRVLLLLGCGSPLHVDMEQMCQQSKADMERQPTEEDRHERSPHEVLDEGAE